MWGTVTVSCEYSILVFDYLVVFLTGDLSLKLAALQIKTKITTSSSKAVVLKGMVLPPRGYFGTISLWRRCLRVCN